MSLVRLEAVSPGPRLLEIQISTCSKYCLSFKQRMCSHLERLPSVLFCTVIPRITTRSVKNWRVQKERRFPVRLRCLIRLYEGKIIVAPRSRTSVQGNSTHQDFIWSALYKHCSLQGKRFCSERSSEGSSLLLPSPHHPFPIEVNFNAVSGRAKELQVVQHSAPNRRFEAFLTAARKKGSVNAIKMQLCSILVTFLAGPPLTNAKDEESC